MTKFTKKDIGKKVKHIFTDTIVLECVDSNWKVETKETMVKKIIEDVIVALPGMSEYEKNYPSKGKRLVNAQNKEGVMLKDHPWEFQKNWELNN